MFSCLFLSACATTTFPGRHADPRGVAAAPESWRGLSGRANGADKRKCIGLSRHSFAGYLGADMASEFRDRVDARLDRYYPGLRAKLAAQKKHRAEVPPGDLTPELKDLMWRNLSEYLDEAEREGIPLVDVRSAEFVTVYRVVSDTPASRIDFAWNYKSPNSTFGEDYVARSVDETMNYLYGGPATLIRYEIPAMLLEYGKFDKEEASFVISRSQLKRFGVDSPAPFATAVAEIASPLKISGLAETPYDETPVWSGTAEKIRMSIDSKKEKSPYLRWLTDAELERLIAEQMNK